jgi:DNA-binding NtrC family response regulator
MKILVVDDNEGLHLIIACWLAKAGGFQLNFAGSGDEALEIYSKHGPYDVVVTDFDHPGADGIQLAEAMRQKTPKQPVVMFTAGMPDSAVRSCRKLKIPVLWKPCEPEELPRLLKAVMATEKTKIVKEELRRRKAKERRK